MPTVRFRLNNPLMSGCREGQRSLRIASERIGTACHLHSVLRVPAPCWHTEPVTTETDYLNRRDYVLPLLTPQMFSLRIATRFTRPTHLLSFSRRNFGGHGIYEKGNPDSPVPDPLWGQNET